MWTYVGPAADIVLEDGFAVDDRVAWRVLTAGFDEDVPTLPADLQGTVTAVQDEDARDRLAGTVTRILMLTGRRRTAATEVSRTPPSHVQVLDLAGFLVEVEPA